MHMLYWISKLDDFLRLSGRGVLEHAGQVSHEAALVKAHEEYEKYRQSHLNDPSPVEEHFLQSVKSLKAAPPSKKSRDRNKT
jgi:hypothetical protein